MIKMLSDKLAAQCMMAMADKNGKLLGAGSVDRLESAGLFELCRAMQWPEVVNAADE